MKVRQKGDDDRKVIRIEARTDRPRKRREKMGRSKKNIRGGRRSVAERQTSKRIRVVDTEFSSFKNRGKEVPLRVTRVPRGKPT
jgi:hypothetical protein